MSSAINIQPLVMTSVFWSVCWAQRG